MRFRTGLLALLVTVTMAQANAPYTSLRPVARTDVFPVALPNFAPSRSLRPVARPSSVAAARPSRVQTPTPARPASSSRHGRVCGDRQIRGENIGRVPGKLAGCGIRNAVKVYEISGVKLSSPATINCDTAKAVKTWFDGGMAKAARRHMRSSVTEVRVVASYSCRTRNHRPGAKLSEHSFGNAIDFAGFTFSNGEKITVLDDWGGGREGRALRDMWRSACGPFGTVLGPQSDRFHKDHFHFDIANHRSGPYCR